MPHAREPQEWFSWRLFDVEPQERSCEPELEHLRWNFLRPLRWQ
nr:MAG TPA: hypothetical protein [Caudoviricetes sp.]